MSEDLLAAFCGPVEANKQYEIDITLKNGLRVSGAMTGADFVRLFRDPSQLENTADEIPAGCAVALCLPTAEIAVLECSAAKN